MSGTLQHLSCHVTHLQVDGKKQSGKEFVVPGALRSEVRKKKQKDKNAATFLAENAKLLPVLTAQPQDDLPVYHQLHIIT